MLGLASEPAIRLAERLVKLAPPGLAKVFYSDAGATATEGGVQAGGPVLAQPAAGARSASSSALADAYHGDTFGAMSVGRTAAFHRPYFPLLFKAHFAPTPFAVPQRHAGRPGHGQGAVPGRARPHPEPSAATGSPPSASSRSCRARPA